MATNRSAWVGSIVLLLVVAGSWLARPAATAAEAGRAHMVYLRGPGDPDCAGERERARGDAGRGYLVELKCRLHTAWKCPATCKGDELLVAHVAAKVLRDGQAADGRVVRNSEARDFDEMCLKAVTGSGPFGAPPPALADPSGGAAVKIEFVCDCAERPKK
jgi:hypothetical protein